MDKRDAPTLVETEVKCACCGNKISVSNSERIGAMYVCEEGYGKCNVPRDARSQSVDRMKILRNDYRVHGAYTGTVRVHDCFGVFHDRTSVTCTAICRDGELCQKTTARNASKSDSGGRSGVTSNTANERSNIVAPTKAPDKKSKEEGEEADEKKAPAHTIGDLAVSEVNYEVIEKLKEDFPGGEKNLSIEPRKSYITISAQGIKFLTLEALTKTKFSALLNRFKPDESSVKAEVITDLVKRDPGYYYVGESVKELTRTSITHYQDLVKRGAAEKPKGKAKAESEDEGETEAKSSKKAPPPPANKKAPPSKKA